MDEIELILQMSIIIHVTITIIFIIYYVLRAQLELIHELYDE